MTVSYDFPLALSWYHNMKGKKEDDDSRPRPINESTRVNHFANLLVHVELEQLSNCSRIQPESMKEEEWNIANFTIIMYFVLFQSNLWWFCYL